ncbi:MAG: PAS domain-containing protein [Syntrophobacteraceae bacterium]
MKENPVRVLLVEDDGDDCLLLLDMLKEKNGSGYSLNWVRDYDTALTEMRNGGYDIALVDYRLGDRNGLELLAQKGDMPRDIPVILLTGRGDPDLDREAMEAGAADYLEKSDLTPVLLERSIRHAIERHKSRKHAERLNRTLVVMKECDRALSQIFDEKNLLREVCGIITEVGGHKFCWVGFADTKASTVVPVAHAGYERGYLGAIRISLAESERGRGPAGVAFRTGLPSVVRDTNRDPRFAPWREEALKRGYASGIALPLFAEHGVFGLLCIYSGERNAFDDEEVRLLQDLANDISFGIISVRNRQQRIHAERALSEKLHFMQLLMDTIPNPIFYKNAAGVYEGCNKAFEEFAGLKRCDIIGKTVHDIAPGHAARVYEAIDSLVLEHGGVQTYVSPVRCADNMIHTIEFTKATYCDREGKPEGVVGIAVDITEKERRQAELRSAVSFSRSIIEACPAYFVAQYLDGRIKMVNRALLNASGYAGEDLLEKDAFSFVVEEDRDRAVRAFEKVKNEKKSILEELRIRTKTGGVRLVEWHGRPVLDQRGQTEFIFVMGIDITERKIADEQIKSLARFPHEDPSCVLRVNREGVILFANEPGLVLLNAWGTKVGEIAPKEWVDLASELLAAGTRRIVEHQADGKVFSITSVPIVDGDYVNFYGVDITEQKQAERALRESEIYFRTLLANMNEDIFVTGRDYLIRDVNRDYLLTVQKHRSEAVGRPCYRVLQEFESPCSKHGLKCGVETVFATGAPFVAKRELVRSDGTVIHFLVLCSPLHDEKGQITHVICATRDISQEVRLEAELRQAQKMEAIGTLAGGIAHDFNNILGIILGYADLTLMDTPPDTQRHANLGEILNVCHRGKELVKQILAFSRKSEQERHPMRVSTILKEALKLLRPALPSTIEIRVKIKTGPDQDLVMADPTQTHQVIMNLCANATQAMGDSGGRLEVELSEVRVDTPDLLHFPDMAPGEYVRLSIKDTGCGIDPSNFDRIFEPYFTTKPPGEGTGLGLSVVHGIVTEHGGAIKVYSEPGAGSVFHVYLPRCESAPPPPRVDPASIPTGDESILLVDDEPGIVKSYGKMLARLGYTVEGKTDSIKALEAFRASPDRFDLVLTDQTMPGLTGIQLARQVREIRPGIPVILCSGFDEAANRTAAEEVGISDFLMKPLLLQEAATTVRAVLDARKEEA